MGDYRFIQIEEEEFEEFEDETEEEEEFEDEIEEEDEEREFEENLIPERIILPVNSNLLDELEVEDDSDYDEDDDYDEEEDDGEYLIPERIILPVNSNLLDGLEDEDDSDYDEDDDYDEEEDDGEYLIPERIILPVNIDLINRLEDDSSDYDDDDDDDNDDDDDEDYEDDEDYQDDEDYEEEEVEELIPVEMTSPARVVSSSIFSDRSVEMNNVWLDNSNDFNGRNEVNRSEIDGLICPICFEAWTSGGEHQISCLPCGHIYGLSCINKWLQQRTSSGKCPQCNSLCTLKDVRVLYASRLCVADEELHKRVRSLEAKCAYLEQKAVLLTHDELIKQICNNPTLVERLSTAIADLNQQQVFP